MLRGADRADVGYKCWYREPVKITSESPTGGKKEALALQTPPSACSLFLPRPRMRTALCARMVLHHFDFGSMAEHPPLLCLVKHASQCKNSSRAFSRRVGLMAEVIISIGGQKITSILSAQSAREMGLKPGQTAAALIKETGVMILRV